MIEFSRVLNVASVLLVIVAIGGIVYALQSLFLAPSDSEFQELFGLTISEVRAFNSNLMDKITLVYHFDAVNMLGLSLSLIFMSLLPFRRGKKWAWYAVLVIFGVALLGQLILVYTNANVLTAFYLPSSIILVILWIVGLLLPVKEFFS